MGVELLGTAVTAFIAFIGFVVWLIRLEGRVNTADKVSADQAKDIEAIRANADAAATAHSETTIALVRVQEQLKHLTNLVERFFTESPRPRSRGPSA